MREDVSAGATSVIRRRNKLWLAGTSRKLFGVCVLMAELWAIFDGLSLCWGIGVQASDY